MLPASARPAVPLQQQISSDRPDWENPAVYAANKQPARATGFPFEDHAALTGDRTRSSRFLLLNGDWAFHFSPLVDGAPKGFEAPGYDVSGWKTISVPSMWQAQGYGQAEYNNITYPFPANRPLVPHDDNETGSYRRDIEFGDGLLQPDRTPNPHLYEVQKVYAPIQFTGYDAASGQLTVVNHHDFIGLDRFAFGWELAEDGVVVARGTMPVPVAAPHGGRATVKLALPAPPPPPPPPRAVSVVSRPPCGSAGSSDACRL